MKSQSVVSVTQIPVLSAELSSSATVHIWSSLPAEAPTSRRSPSDSRQDNRSAQLGLRALLSSYRGKPWRESEWRRGPFGKPYLESGPEFNLTHSGGGFVVALSSDPVGVDMEWRGRRGNWKRIADKYFSPAEKRQLQTATSEFANELFLRFWVCKEAMAKLVGEGIYRLLAATEVQFQGETVSAKVRDKIVLLEILNFRSGAIAAVAHWGPAELKTFEIPQDLISTV